MHVTPLAASDSHGTKRSVGAAASMGAAAVAVLLLPLPSLVAAGRGALPRYSKMWWLVHATAVYLYPAFTSAETHPPPAIHTPPGPRA